MNRLRKLRLFSAILTVCHVLAICPASATMAAEPSAEPAGQTDSVDRSLSTARELIKSGDYDRAIEILRTAIAGARSNLSRLRDGYLLLIKTYVFLGNDYKFKPQGREASNLNYKAAREMITECLRIKELRHTRPEPASEYPPEMISAFEEVRSQIFGSFRIGKLEPREAAVVLGGDTLRILPGDSLLGEIDLALGPHLVVVRAAGYKDLTDEITISPNSMLERSYQLPRRRSRTWYATVATGTVGVVGGVIALIAGGGKGSTAAEPLPGPPPPPTPTP